LWDVATGHQRAVLQGHTYWIGSLAFSGDGKTLASGSADQTVRLWDLATGQQRALLKGHTGIVHSVAFSPDGKTLASAGGFPDNTVRLWDAATGKERAVLKVHTSTVLSLAFSPDGKTLASGGTVQIGAVFPVSVVGALGSGLGQGPLLSASTLSPYRPQTVILGEVRLWDVATGQQRAVLSGHASVVYSVCFSPDGKTLASGSWDKTVRLWDVATGQQKAALQGHTGPVRSVAFSRDGQSLASGSEDQTVRLWRLSPP
jgi:WD40 repeat protein